MKLRKDLVIGCICIVIIAAGVRGVYVFSRHQEQSRLALRIAQLGRGGPPSNIEDLRKVIALYEKKIELHVKDAAQAGIYWRILAVRLQDRGLHRDALAALERALSYNAEDVSLLYLTGVSAANVAKSSVDIAGALGEPSRGDDPERYYALAETAYLRAIDMAADYARPRYALGVLYVFELDRAEEAIPHLLRYAELNSADMDGLFVLARAYYITSRFQNALEIYDRIIAGSRDGALRAEAEQNRALIQESIYGR